MSTKVRPIARQSGVKCRRSQDKGTKPLACPPQQSLTVEDHGRRTSEVTPSDLKGLPQANEDTFFSRDFTFPGFSLLTWKQRQQNQPHIG